MTRILYDTTTATLRPYPRNDDGPVVGLDSRYLDLALLQEPAPPFDPQTQRLEPTETINIDAATVTRGWQVIELLPPTPGPDWERFQADLQTANGFPAAWGAIFSGDPRPGIGLISALLDWRATGQWAQFLGAALACLALLPPEQGAHVGLELLALATDCNLDPAFCQALETFLEASS